MATQHTNAPSRKPAEGTRNIVARAFTWVEDIVYVGLGA
jgi:hypothetical protein